MLTIERSWPMIIPRKNTHSYTRLNVQRAFWGIRPCRSTFLIRICVKRALISGLVHTRISSRTMRKKQILVVLLSQAIQLITRYHSRNQPVSYVECIIKRVLNENNKSESCYCQFNTRKQYCILYLCAKMYLRLIKFEDKNY